MRLDPRLGVTAADLINALNEGELYELFSRYGEEHFARRLARALVSSRRKEKITTSSQLAALVEQTLGRSGKIHPATRVFMALRIAVNDEIGNLRKGLLQAAESLEGEGRVVVISFHSLEDREVKHFFQGRGDLRILTDGPVTPSADEVSANPRSRSAKLRAAEKI
jgi:16S rRNA (cytosine1402-N4)-methyltransferase